MYCGSFPKTINVQLDAHARMPTRAHETDAGLDLYTRESFTIPAHRSACIDTGVHIELPKGTFGKIESKSGLNVKHDVVSCGGVIDEGYTGSIVVKLYNLGEKDYIFHLGEKIAQLVIIPCMYVGCKVVEELDNDTERQANGFGSSGK